MALSLKAPTSQPCIHPPTSEQVNQPYSEVAHSDRAEGPMSKSPKTLTVPAGLRKHKSSKIVQDGNLLGLVDLARRC
jgi:hypothetical protein